MNLLAITRPLVSAVNPNVPATLRISMGNATDASGARTALFETPGSITAAIAGTVLTVSAVSAGYLRAGQALAGVGVVAGSLVGAQISGTPGGVGTYAVAPSQTVASSTMTTSLTVSAQVQPMTWRDLQSVDGLNLQGSRVKVYLFGKVDGIVRPLNKGGDLITIPAGVWAGTYLVAQTLEQYPDWCSLACTLQNG